MYECQRQTTKLECRYVKMGQGEEIAGNAKTEQV